MQHMLQVGTVSSFKKRTRYLCTRRAKGKPRNTPWGEMTYIEYKHKIEFNKREYDLIDKYCKSKPIHWTARYGIYQVWILF